MEAATTNAARPRHDSTSYTPLKKSLAWLQRKADEAATRGEKNLADTPAQMFLPGFDIGAFPKAHELDKGEVSLRFEAMSCEEA